MSGKATRAEYHLRLRVAREDAGLGDRGTRVDGVLSCCPLVEKAAGELDRLAEAETLIYAICQDLAGCIGLERNGVNELRDKLYRLKATIVGIEYEPDCDHRWDWPDGTTRHGRPPTPGAKP